MKSTRIIIIIIILITTGYLFIREGKHSGGQSEEHGMIPIDKQTTNQPLTTRSARQLLRQGFDLRGQGKHEEAIRVLKRVVAFDPKLEADFPDESIHLQATGELAMTYFTHKDWARAIPLLEQCEKDMREKNPDADTIAPTLIAECRKRLKAEESSK